MKNDVTTSPRRRPSRRGGQSHRRGQHAALVFAIATALATSYALPSAQQATAGSAQARPAAQSAASAQAAPAKKVLTVADYPKWRTHQRPGDFRRWQLGQLRPGADQHRRHRSEAGPAHRPRRNQPAHRSARTPPAACSPPTRNGSPTRWIPPADVAAAAAVAARRRRLRPSLHRVATPRCRRAHPADAPPANPAQVTTPPGQNPQTTPTQPASDASHRHSPPPPPRHPHPRRRSSPPAGAQAPAPAGRGARHTAADTDARRAAQSRDWRDQVVAGHPVVRVFGELDAPDSEAKAGDRCGGRGWRTRRGCGRRRRPAPAGGTAAGGAATPPAGPRGTDVILHNLVTGRDQLLGSVGDIAFNKAR